MNYTIGEIFRGEMLKTHEGKPYSDKATVSRVVSGWKFKEKKTAWGVAKTFSDSQIEKHNAKWD